MTEAAATSLLDTWLSAQNRGDIAAYEGLYADRFTGVRRSGERTRNFGREGWMKDRAKMFEKPMQVGIDALELDVSGTAVRARFEQSWASGTYRDRGPKELLIVAGAAGPRIAREEMLRSTIDENAPGPGGQPLLLIDHGAVVLADEVASDWARGAPRAVASGDEPVATVLRDVDEARLPPALGAFKGRALQAVAADGSACATRVAALAIRGAVVPHFSFGNPEEGAGRALSEEQRNEELWSLSESGHELVGLLDPPCAGLWALDAAQPVPAAYAPQPADAALEGAARAALRRLPSYAAIQKHYVRDTGLKTAWDVDPTHHELVVSVFRPTAGPALVWVSAQAGEYCGGFGGSLNALFEHHPGKKPELSPLIAFQGEMATAASAVDGDADGALEILTGPYGLSRERGLIRRRGGRLEHTILHSVPFLDCPC